jgi:hypothetical protein
LAEPVHIGHSGDSRNPVKTSSWAPAYAGETLRSKPSEPDRGERIDLVVLSSLFPSAARPGAGLFIRERMFRVEIGRAHV